MRRTYAYNSIIFGVLIGILIALSTKNYFLGILAGLGISVVGFIIIRLIENAIYKGVDKAADSISNAYRRHKANKAEENGVYAPPTTVFPTREQPRHEPVSTPQPTYCAPEYNQPNHTHYCPYCGSAIEGTAYFCPGCGSKLQ